MHILIIEDDSRTANYLKKGLTENNFTADVTTNGLDGLHQATNIHYDLIILDVMLPKLKGWDILTRLRQAGYQTPILFLTACDSTADKVQGLKSGADDYLVKPFAFSELLARVRTLLRRGQIRPIDHLTIADLEINLIEHKVKRGNQLIDLTQKEFNLLTLLLKRKGELLPRTFIAEQIWDMNFDSGTNVIDVAIRRLRQKIDDPFDKKLIHAIRGIGYVMEER